MSEFVYCLNTSTIRPTPLLEKIRLAGEHGFAAIELWLDDVIEYTGQGGGLDDVSSALADRGLAVVTAISLKGWSDASPVAYPGALEECRRRMDLAAQIGAVFVIASPSLVPADLDVVAARYRELLEIGRQIGVRPAMEFLGFCQSVWRIDQAWRIVCAADPSAAEPTAAAIKPVADDNATSAATPPNANGAGTIVLDSFHLYRGGSDLDDLKRIPADRIAVFHLNDAPAAPARKEQTDADRVMPGDGILDLRSQLSQLSAAGYRGPISLELFNRELWSRDPDEVVRLGMERMRALLG